jgi:hypothetical protein
MARPDNSSTEGYRLIYGYNSQFDVVIAGAFEECERGPEVFELYDAIGEVVRSIGKRPFLPNRDIDLGWMNEQIYDIPNEIVIPTSDIVLCYAGLPSSAAGMMAGSAIFNKIPLVYFFDNARGKNLDSPKLFAGRILDLIEFKDNDECCGKLEAFLKQFYSKPL